MVSALTIHHAYSVSNSMVSALIIRHAYSVSISMVSALIIRHAYSVSISMVSTLIVFQESDRTCPCGAGFLENADLVDCTKKVYDLCLSGTTRAQNGECLTDAQWEDYCSNYVSLSLNNCPGIFPVYSVFQIPHRIIIISVTCFTPYMDVCT
jgi:hypothetical protein